MQNSCQQVFQSDNHGYYDLSNSKLDFIYIVLSKSFLNSKIVLIIIVQLLYNVMQQVVLNRKD